MSTKPNKPGAWAVDDRNDFGPPQTIGARLADRGGSPDLPYPSMLITGGGPIRDAVVERFGAAEREALDHVAQTLVSPVMQREGGPVFREDVKDGDRIHTNDPVELLEWFCPNIGHDRAERIAREGRHQGIMISIASLRALITANWEEPASRKIEGLVLGATPGVNSKPAQLAAGQVWERTLRHGAQRRTLTYRDPDDRLEGEYWHFAEKPGAATPAWALLTMDEARYLGTREEVEGRALAAELLATGADVTPEQVAIIRRAVGDWKEQAGESDDALRARVFAEAPDRYSRGWFIRYLSKSLGVPPSTITIDESEIGTVAVSVDGYPMGKLAELLDEWRPFLPMHVHFVARHRPAPTPTLANGPHPHVAQPRDCRTAGDHAGALAKHVLAAPSPRAPRAAASPSLAAWQELPHFWRRWTT